MTTERALTALTPPDRPPQPEAQGPRGRRSVGRRHLVKYIGTRILLIIPSMFIAATITFFLVNSVPSDPLRVLLGDYADPAAVVAMEEELGLDRPLWQRYLDYVQGLVQGDMGTSYQTREPILHEILSRLPATLVLTVPAIAIAAFLGIRLGVSQASSRRPGLFRGVITVLQSLPAFVLGIFGILLLVTTVSLLPSPTGQLDIALPRPPDVTGAVLLDGLIAGDMAVVANAAGHLVLPVISLALVLTVPFARISASTVGANLAADYTQFGTGNGLRRRVVVRNATKSARTSIVVVTGIVTAELVGGAVIIEQLFAWNGLGRWSLESILLKDIPAVQGFVLLATAGTILVYLVADIIGTVLDPRYR